MSRAMDLTGQAYGRLSAVCLVKRQGGHSYWLWCCDCGGEVVATANNVRRGNTRSCGCLAAEVAKTAGGMHRTPEYTAWENMLSRCRRPNHPQFRDYGGRGITVDPGWLDFNRFYADMGPRPSPKHTLERVDNGKSYGKDNCVWATRDRQARNTRRTRLLTHGGRTLCLTDWAREAGLSVGGLRKRLALGWPLGRALGGSAGG